MLKLFTETTTNLENKKSKYLVIKDKTNENAANTFTIRNFLFIF